MISPRYRRSILATCCVPWNERFEFEEDIFRRSVRLQIDSGIRDLYIFGTAGEGYAVTDTQFDAITRVFLDETKRDDVQAMVGLIGLSLPTIIERIERARDMGARRFQLSLPSWGVLSDTELKTFFRETCGRFPDCEFLHYNLMRSGRIITGTEYGMLAAEHANLVATKNSTADEVRLRSLFIDAPQLRHFITEVGFAKACHMGDCGFLISFLFTNFQRAQDYFQAGCDRDSARLDAITADFDGLIATFKEAVGDTAHMDGAFDKLFCRIHDPEFPLRLLPPYESVSTERFDRYRDQLRARHPDWLP
ncbi:MAG: dihydrodipicolinate synthase family protein [Verrucomicrobiaceae bacterium]|nr:dihydrodipicolinate synthase family protein [Verrucomicrobiaceae bacterium]